MAKREPRTVSLAEIERRFTVAPLVLAHMTHPAVGRRTTGVGWYIRVRTASRGATESFDYFYLAEDGAIEAAPRGYAKDYRPGRVEVSEVEAAVERYAREVSRG